MMYSRLVILFAIGLSSCSSSNPVSSTPPVTTPPVETTYTVSGRITVGISTTGIPGATITVGGVRNAGKTTTTDANGNYSISGLFFEGFNFTISAPGYISTAPSVLLTAGTTSRTLNASLLPTAVWTVSGTGNTVFEMPNYFSQVRIHGQWLNRDTSNFIVHLAGRSLVNEILRTSITYDAVALTNGGGTVEIVSSGAISWTFTEVR